MARILGSSAARALRTAAGRVESRGALVKAVRAACRRLGLEDEDRRAIQLELTGKRSMSDMTLAEIGQLLDRLNRDWKGPMGHRAHVGKIRALWWTLYWLGAVDNPNDIALNAFVKRQTGKERLRFLGSREAHRVIEALKAMAERAGVRWPADADIAALAEKGKQVTIQQLERRAVARAIGDKLADARIIVEWSWWCRAALRLADDPYAWTERELDACIRALGKKLRRHLALQVDE